jgi:hypothetical protein
MGKNDRISTRIGYTLFFLPLLSLYPIYYLYLSFNDIDADERLENSPLRETYRFNPNSLTLPTISIFVFGLLVVLATYGRKLFIGTTISTTPTALLFGDLGMVITGILVGIFITLLLGLGIERELSRRLSGLILVGVVLSAIFVIIDVLLNGIPIQPIELIDTALPPLFAAVYSGAVANGYLVRKQAILQINGVSSGSDHTETKSYIGNSVGNEKGQKLVERLAESKWIVPDNLPEVCSVEETREVEPLRDTIRGLWVKEKHYEKTVPETRFSKEKSNHRSDFEKRDRVAPDGFASAVYTFYVPKSKDTTACDSCSGKGELTCDDCRGSGSVRCGSCNGDGYAKCRDCRGDGRIVVDQKCGVCRGTGEKKVVGSARTVVDTEPSRSGSGARTALAER